MWLLPKEEDKTTISDACLVLPTQDHRIENVLWNPLAEGVLAVSVDKCVKLFDVASATEKIGNLCPITMTSLAMLKHVRNQK